MGLIDMETAQGGEPSPRTAHSRHHASRFGLEFETVISQLYLATMNEPVPLRLLTILRAGVCGSKA
jgi:hypothetical protein